MPAGPQGPGKPRYSQALPSSSGPACIARLRSRSPKVSLQNHRRDELQTAKYIIGVSRSVNTAQSPNWVSETAAAAVPGGASHKATGPQGTLGVPASPSSRSQPPAPRLCRHRPESRLTPGHQGPPVVAAGPCTGACTRAHSDTLTHAPKHTRSEWRHMHTDTHSQKYTQPLDGARAHDYTHTLSHTRKRAHS